MALSTPVLSTPSSSPPVMPISISSQIPSGAMRLKYLAQISIFSCLGSSDKSRRRGLRGASWSTFHLPRAYHRTTGDASWCGGRCAGQLDCRDKTSNSENRQNNPYIHAVSLGHIPDVERGREGSKDGCLLLVVGKPLARKVGASALRDLEDDGSLDIPTAYVNAPLFPINEKRRLTWQLLKQHSRWT